MKAISLLLCWRDVCSVCLCMSFIVFSRDIPLVRNPLQLSPGGERPLCRQFSCCHTKVHLVLGQCQSCSSFGIPESERDHVLWGLEGERLCWARGQSCCCFRNELACRHTDQGRKLRGKHLDTSSSRLERERETSWFLLTCSSGK